MKHILEMASKLPTMISYFINHHEKNNFEKKFGIVNQCGWFNTAVDTIFQKYENPYFIRDFLFQMKSRTSGSHSLLSTLLSE